jgi:hypothetical protein
MRAECGGLAKVGESASMLGCFEPCAGCVGGSRCTFTCPSRTDFIRRVSAAGMLLPIAHPRFPKFEASALPRYLTVIQGGVYFERPVKLSFAALNLAEVFHGDKAQGISFGRRVLTRESVRKEWGLASDSKILLSGVSKDQPLECLWSNHQSVELAAQVAALGVAGVTAPNFTFWKEKPRFHNMWNRRRMLKMCERFAAAGVPVIPHINSTHPADWDFWFQYLREHPELVAVCLEFRTGNRRFEVRDRKIAALYDLRERLGREIHPIITGNIEAASLVGQYFLFYTAVDSTPVIKTIKRQRMVVTNDKIAMWRTAPVAARSCMADAFEANYRDHAAGVDRRLTAGPSRKKTLESKPVDSPVEELSEASTQLREDELPLFLPST